MNRSIQMLAGLLLTQGALVAWFSQGSDSLATFKAVTTLTLKNSDNKELVLTKRGENWIVPELKDFPADSKKITSSLKKLAELKRSFPVARTEIAQKQLKVADESFEEKITVAAPSGEQAVFLGTAPSFRNTHVRRSGETDIYSFQLASYDFPVDSAGWVNSDELFVTQESLKQIELKGVTFVKKDGAFLVNDLAADEHIVAEERDSLVAQLTKMRFLKVLLGNEADAAEEVVKINYTPESGDVFSVSLFRKEKPAVTPTNVEGDAAAKAPDVSKPEKTYDYFLRSSKLPHLMSVGQGIVDKLSGITRAALVAKDVKPAGVESLDAAALGNPSVAGNAPGGIEWRSGGADAFPELAPSGEEAGVLADGTVEAPREQLPTTP
jgi:hypothetical protein